MNLRSRLIAVYYFIDFAVPTRRDLTYWLAGYAGVTACVIIIGAVMVAVEMLVATPVPESANHAVENTVTQSQSNGREPAWLSLLAGLWLAAFWEEIAFRNFMQKILVYYTTPWTGIIVTSLVFAVLHLGSYGGIRPGIFVPIFMAFLSAVWMGWTYHRTQNIAVPILIHGCINTTALVSLYLG